MKTRLQLLLAVALCSALILVGVAIWVDRMTPVTIAIAPVSDQLIRVEVRGSVAAPGIVEVPTGARLADVVDAAGGFLEDADLSRLNLAGRVGDGERVDIPSMNDPVVEATVEGSVTDLLDINTASEEELQELPGIGEVLSARIVEYREEHGPFESVDDLQDVEGISPRLVEELRPLVTVSSAD